MYLLFNKDIIYMYTQEKYHQGKMWTKGKHLEQKIIENWREACTIFVWEIQILQNDWWNTNSFEMLDTGCEQQEDVDTNIDCQVHKHTQNR